MKIVANLLLGTVLTVASVSAQPFEKMLEVGKAAPAFEAHTIAGEVFSLKEHFDKVVVLEWVNYDCPWVQKHYKSQNMQKLQEKWTAEGVVWVSVATGKTADQQKLEKGSKTYQSKATHLVLDPEGTVGKLYNAKATPQCYIILKGKVIYAGAIDSNKSAKVESVADAENYVEAVLSSLGNKDQPPLSVKARPYGSRVQYKDF